MSQRTKETGEDQLLYGTRETLNRKVLIDATVHTYEREREKSYASIHKRMLRIKESTFYYILIEKQIYIYITGIVTNVSDRKYGIQTILEFRETARPKHYKKAEITLFTKMTPVLWQHHTNTFYKFNIFQLLT